MNLRLQPEFATISSVPQERRPWRVKIPLFFQIGRRSARWRDFPASRAHSDMLDGHQQSIDRPTRKQQEEEFVLNDQTLSTFLGKLRIRLPQWHTRSLQDELNAYYEQEEKKKKHNG